MVSKQRGTRRGVARSAGAGDVDSRPHLPVDALLDADCRHRLAGLALLDAAVVAVTGTSPLRFAVAVDVVATALNAPAFDVHLLVPKGSRWSADEAAVIVDKLHLAPLGRTVVAIAAADRMSPALFDRLLATFESPPSGMVVLLGLEDAAAMPKTLAARCARQVAVEIPDRSGLADRLAGMGMSPELAESAETSALAADLALAGTLDALTEAVVACRERPALGPYALVRACTEVAAATSSALAVTVHPSHVLALVLADLRLRLTAAASVAAVPNEAVAAFADLVAMQTAAVHDGVGDLVPFLQRVCIAVAACTAAANGDTTGPA